MIEKERERLRDMKTLDLNEYPTLSGLIDWGIVKSNFSFTNTVDESMVSNVSIIPFSGSKCVIFQIDNGNWELPGGTLEAGEIYIDGLKREVMEELGAELLSYHVFGQFNCVSSAKTPYKSHIPHPNFVRLLGHGEVKIVGEPLNPDDGEKVIAVELVDIDEAIKRFEEIKRYDIAEMYKLAFKIREHNKKKDLLENKSYSE